MACPVRQLMYGSLVILRFIFKSFRFRQVYFIPFLFVISFLPAMDDDDLRRGRPTCHRAYDEATAILVGDALQALAFEVLANHSGEAVSPTIRLAMIRTLIDGGEDFSGRRGN